MNFDFILDDNFLACRILENIDDDKSDELKIIREKFPKGYRKLLGKEVMDINVFISNNNKVKDLLKELINTKKFNDIYKLHEGEEKEKLAIKILNGIFKEDRELTELKNDLWFKHMEAYKSIFNVNFIDVYNLLIDEDIKEIVSEFKKTNFFEKMYNETLDYLNEIKVYFEKNKDMINKYLKETLKMDIDMTNTVFVSHPDTCVGFNIGNGKIAWGHKRGLEDPNYNIVYLVHEGLHSLFAYDTNENEIECNIKHSIIEFISDYELYSLVSGKSTLKEGHPYLSEYKRIIYPYWLQYMGLDNSQIEERMKKDSVDEIESIDDYNLYNMNIEEFITFCKEKYKELRYTK